MKSFCFFDFVLSINTFPHISCPALPDWCLHGRPLERPPPYDFCHDVLPRCFARRYFLHFDFALFAIEFHMGMCVEAHFLQIQLQLT